MKNFAARMPEEELIKKCREGDSTAFGPLIKNYRKQLFTYLLRLCGDKTSAEDLFQDTLIKVWKGIKKYNEQNKFSSWLFTIAHNTAMDSYRKMKSRENVLDTAEVPDNSSTNNPHSEIVALELNEIINSAVNKLPGKQKQVFLLRQHGELTFKEIADTTNEPLNTVLSHMHYAVKKIKTVLRNENVI